MSRFGRWALLCALIGAAALPAGADDGKRTINLDGVRHTRHTWHGTISGTTLDKQLSAGSTRPAQQNCRDEVTCSITNFYLDAPPKLKARKTGDFTLWFVLGPKIVRSTIVVYDGKNREVAYQDVTTKGTEPTKVSRTLSKLPKGFYQVVIYGIASYDEFSAEARWTLGK